MRYLILALLLTLSTPAFADRDRDEPKCPRDCEVVFLKGKKLVIFDKCEGTVEVIKLKDLPQSNA